MDLILTRDKFKESGVFGILEDADESILLYTCEHAYKYTPDGLQSSASWLPKIPSGTYICERGLHLLNGMTEPFETFQIMDVPGHSNILFHTGNSENDSEGCVLLGLDRNDSMVIHSKDAFQKFMQAQEGLDQFILTVA